MYLEAPCPHFYTTTTISYSHNGCSWADKFESLQKRCQSFVEFHPLGNVCWNIWLIWRFCCQPLLLPCWMIENMSHAQSLLTVAMVTDAGSTKNLLKFRWDQSERWAHHMIIIAQVWNQTQSYDLCVLTVHVHIPSRWQNHRGLK